jgi:hypothetical protein
MPRIPRTEFIEAISALAGEVWDFHERWGVEERLPDRPCERIAVRQPMLREEMRELDEEVESGDSALLAEEAADVAFVAMGHLAALERLTLPAVGTVVAKNAAKTGLSHYVDATSGKITRRSAANPA